MRIDDGVKREILARTDIGEVIGAYVSLRKRGNDLVGLCPFHGENSPSFHVHPDKGFFKCFGCDAKGDVFTFVQKHENLTFPDALRLLAKRVGVALEEEDPRAARVRSEKEAIYHANDVARAWFARMLLDEREGAAARAYCERRGIARETIESFALGYAPDAWDGLVGELRRNDVDLGLAVKAGLLKPSQRGGFYDFYRGRLMIPTFATTGETIAFGGRALGDAEPKYLNTATTPVYTKGRYLYALNAARRAAAKEDTLIVVEGYLDCVALHQAGFPNAVAALGTAFTPEQAREVRKVAGRALLCYDADAAGVEAALKSIEVLSAEGVSAWALRIPEGKDPDEFVRRNGADAFRALLAKPVAATQVKIDAEIERRGNRAEGSALARWAEETIRRLAPAEEQDRWRVYAAGRLGLDVNDLRKARLLLNPLHFAPRGIDQHGSRHIVPGVIEKPTFEREVLAIVLDEPSLVGEYAGRILAERFENPALRRLWQALCAHASSLVQPSDVLAVFAGDEDAAATLASVSGFVRLADSDDRRAKLDRVVARFARDDAERRCRELGERIDRLFAAGETVPPDLRTEHAELKRKLTKG
ncbi:MAG: primase [Candidatus Eremiobacteraeota bacterium]|nr:primase [Candidatus Eremiobacteraeota bacterium]